MSTRNPPSSWHVLDRPTTEWGRDVDQDSTGAEQGGNVVRFLAVATGADPTLLETDFFPMEQRIFHEVYARIKSTSNAMGDNVKFFIDFFDKDFVLITTRALHDAPAVSAGVFEYIGNNTGSVLNAVWGKLRIGKTRSAGFSVDFDHVNFVARPTNLTAFLNASPQVIPGGVFTTVLFDAAGGNRVNYVPGTGTATILIPGYYHVSSTITWDEPGGDRIAMRLTKNGSPIRLGNQWKPEAATDNTIILSADIVLAINDALQIEVFTEDGDSIINGEANTNWQFHRVAAA